MAVWQTNNIAASADRCRKEEETMNRSSRTVKLVEMALLVAIILILAFTPLGYIKTLGLEITLIVVPVTIGAIILGPLGGAVLGICTAGIYAIILIIIKKANKTSKIRLAPFLVYGLAIFSLYYEQLFNRLSIVAQMC